MEEVRQGAVRLKLQLYIGPVQAGDHGNGNGNYKKPENAGAMPSH